MMTDTLKQCIADPECLTIKIATGYWDIPGMELVLDELKGFLEREGTSVQLLIGSDPVVRAYQLQHPLAHDARFPQDYIKRDIRELQVSENYVEVVKLLLKYCIDEGREPKFHIRIYKYGEEREARFLHAKCYIFKSQDKSVGIIGSSNFTKQGLEGNAELNYLETDGAIVTAQPQEGSASKGHLCWFDSLWVQAVDWNFEFLEEVLKPAAIGRAGREALRIEHRNITPYELYIKYLQVQFGDIADPSTDAVLKSYLPAGYDALDYQLDAVKQCFFIMKQHGGFILADVVGLGKTVVGLLIVRKFLDEAAAMNRERKVLIVTPPAVKSAWQRTIETFDRGRSERIATSVDFITTGSVEKLMSDSDPETAVVREDIFDEFDGALPYASYGLILVDESHNFRNSDTKKYQDLNHLIGTIQLRTGRAPYVGLLSATPQNNSPQDIKNQIYLFQREPNRSTLSNIPGGRLDSFFAEKQRQFRANRSISNTPAGQAALRRLAQDIREKVLNDLVIRRTRKDIAVHYSEDSKRLKFPTVQGPIKLEYRMDAPLCRLFAETMDAILPDEKQVQDPKDHIGFYRYSAIMFFKSDEHKKLYEKRNLTVEAISKRLARIMQILLVKRLESSFSAFKKSLHNLQRYTQNMIEMIQADCVFVCPDIDVNAEFAKAPDFETACRNIRIQIARKGGNNRQFKRTDLQDKYLELLLQDKRRIDQLCAQWDRNDFDPKLDAFKEYLQSELFNPRINNPGGYDTPKLVIFTEALDTLDSLARHIESKGYRVLKVSAANRDELQEEIKANFDANAAVQRNDYDVIVTTEVLAEGVNLHRANVILNYDTPWNATRLMQRIGRVNRIGSREEFVHVFNFYPTVQGNEQIQLVETAYAKLQAFHTMFGEDNRVFSEMEQLSAADFNKMMEDEESPFGCHIAALKAFQRSFPERYKELMELEFKGLGGKMQSCDTGKSWAVVTTEQSGLLNVRLPGQGEEAEIVSSLEFMTHLRCTPDAVFDPAVPSRDITRLTERAITCYNLHVTRMLSSHDATRQMKTALGIVQRIYKQLTTETARKALLTARHAVEHGNITVMKVLFQYDRIFGRGQTSLFGEDFEIDSWIESAFGSIAEQAVRQHGKPYMAMFEIQ